MSRKLFSIVLGLAGALTVSACSSGGNSSSIQEYTLTYEASTGGSIDGPTEQVVEAGEDSEPVTAVPDTGYHFVQWSDGLATASRTDTDVQEEVSVTAEFARNEYTLNYTVHEDSFGSISGPSHQTVTHGANAQTVTAVPASGYSFVQWSDGVTTAERTDTNVEDNLTVTAEFSINEYTLTYQANSGGSISGPSHQTVTHGANAQTVTAVPASGYSFVQWSDGVTTAERTDTNVENNLTVTAEFSINEYTLSYDAGAGGSISGNAEQTVSHGNDAETVTAVPDTGYAFDQWSDGVTTAERTDTNVQGNLSVTVEFVQAYSIGGTVSGLEGSDLVLQNNDGDSLTITDNGTFTFPTEVGDGHGYDVTVYQHPEDELCLINNASGIVNAANVDDITVACEDLTLDVHSDFYQVTLNWSTDTPINVLYSTDPDCDWDNYTSCDNGTMLIDQGSGLTLGRNDGLKLNQNYFFIIEAEGARSMVAGGSPWAPGMSGSVYSTLVHEGRLYIGGGFKRMGPTTTRGVMLNADDGQPKGALQGINGGRIRTVIADGQGGWYIGGDFNEVAGEARSRLARIRADGSVDPDWNPGANDRVRSLAIHNGTVYAGGEFTSAGGGSRENLAAFDATTGALDPDWNPGANGRVYSLAAYNGTVYAGGEFTSAGGEARERLAAFDAATGVLDLDWNPGANGGVVSSLAIHNGTVYAGGFFTSAGGEARNYLAAFDATTGALDPDWNPGANNGVLSLAIHGGTFYAGGNFTSAGGETRNYLAAFDDTTGALDPDWNPGANGSVYSLAIHNGTVYAGGGFTSAGGEARERLAAFDDTTAALDPDWNPGADRQVHSLAIYNGTVYAGGFFNSVGGEARNYLAAFDVTTGALDPDWNPGANNQVWSLAVYNGTVYAGGGFTSAGGETRERLAAFDAATGALDPDWNPGVNSSFGGWVYSLAIHDGSVYAGGEFTSAGGEARENLAAFDATTGTLDPDWNPGATCQIDLCFSEVRSLVIHNGTVYTGGEFTTAGGEARENLAAFDATTGALDPDWNPGANNPVLSLAIQNSTVYAGGEFTTAGGETRNRLAAFDNTTGALDPDWNPEANRQVYSLAVQNGSVYAGGEFTIAGGEAREHLAAFDAATGALDPDWNPGANNQVYSLAIHNDTVYAGGFFTTAGGEARSCLATFDAISGVLVW